MPFQEIKNKKALLIGINYVKTDYELKGCINDIINVKNKLTSSYGFKLENINTIQNPRLDPLPFAKILLPTRKTNGTCYNTFVAGTKIYYEYLFNRILEYNPRSFFLKEKNVFSDFLEDYQYFNLNSIDEIEKNIKLNTKTNQVAIK